MISRLIQTMRDERVAEEGTGTFADGVFHLSMGRQSDFDRDHSRRASYQRDVRVGRELGEVQALFG